MALAASLTVSRFQPRSRASRRTARTVFLSWCSGYATRKIRVGMSGKVGSVANSSTNRSTLAAALARLSGVQSRDDWTSGLLNAILSMGSFSVSVLGPGGAGSADPAHVPSGTGDRASDPTEGGPRLQ